MTVINTNTAAINAQYNLSKVQSEQENAMERLSSGLRINSASDDAAGVAIASRMNAEITGTNMAIRNAMDSQAMIDTAEGAHVEVESILQRMRELSVQSANDTYSDTDRANLQAELSQLQTEVDRIAMATNWGGKNLLNGTSLSSPAASHSETRNFQFQVGTGSAMVNSIDVSIGAISSSALGVGVGSAAASVGNASVTASTDSAPARVSISDGKVSITGKPQVGDVFKFDVNGEEISITYSVSDEYTDDLAGLSAQMKNALETKINDNAVAPSLAAVSVIDNGDGSISLVQSTTPTLDSATNDETGGGTADNSAIVIDGNTVRMSGTFDSDSGNDNAGDKFGVTINGVAIEITATTTDAFSNDFTGLGAQLKAAIDANATLNGYVTATDNKDGSVTITQATSPSIQAAETTLAKTQTSGMAFTSNAITTGSTAIANATAVGVTEFTTPVDGEVNVIKLTSSESGSIEFGGKTNGTAADATLTQMKAAFDGLADKKGFSATLSNNTLSFSRTDGDNFSIEKGATAPKIIELEAVATPNDGAVRNIILGLGTTNELQLSTTNTDVVATMMSDIKSSFDALSDQKGFQIAQVGNVLQFSRMDGVTFTISSSSDDLQHDAGTNTAAAAFAASNTQVALNWKGGGTAAAANDVFLVELTGSGTGVDHNGDDLDNLSFSTAAASVGDDTEIIDAIKTAFDLQTDKRGYTAAVAANVITFTRIDGATVDLEVTETANGTAVTLQANKQGAGAADLTLGTAIGATTGNYATNDVSVGTATALSTNLKEDITSGGAAITTTAVTTTGAFGADTHQAGLKFSGGYVSGKEYSVDILGTKVSIVAEDNDGFENSLNGLANQMTQAINDAGIAGISAATSSDMVKLTATPVLANAKVVKDQTTIDAGIAIATNNVTGVGTITLSGTIENGDEFAFSINGQDVSFKYAADGFSNTAAGVKSQLKEAIENAGIVGLTVAEAASGTAVDVSMSLETATNSKSTVVTNTSVTDTPKATLTILAEDGSIKVEGEVTKGDTFDFSVEGQSFTVVGGADGAELTAKGVAAQVAAAVNAAGVPGVNITDNGDGSVSFNTTAVKITDAQSAKDSIAVIDGAIETINRQRANLGGVSNRLDNTVTNLSNVSANLQSSLSRIQDADFATETSNLTKSQILSQAATAMLAQANASKQGVLSLLQG